MKSSFHFVLKTAVALCLASLTAQADDNLALNGDFEKANAGGDWPEGWAKPKTGGSWGKEETNHFLTLKSSTPGEMVMLYQEFKIPAGTEALEVSWKQRITGLKKGTSPWFDARIMLEFSTADRAKMAGSPKAPSAGKDSAGWEEKKISFLVPQGAAFLKFMPALFQVASGTFELDDIVIKKTDPAPIKATVQKEAEERALKLAATAASRRTKAAAAFEKTGLLIQNGDFQKDGKGKGWPDLWSKPAGGVWGDEDGNRFVSLNATEPGKTVLLHRSIDLPAGVKALELTWRQRVTGLKRGKMPWFDARIMMEFEDAGGEKLKQKPKPAYTQKDTNGWVEKSAKFLVPDEALSLVLMPALFEVLAGKFDLDDFKLKPADPEELLAAQREAEALAKANEVPAEEPAKDKWPRELKVQGNRLVDPDGNEAWLQGVSIPSLEWSLTGESILKSTLVSIQDWKAKILRLPINDEFWFGKGSQADGGKAYRELIDQIVTLAANRGAYVVLDLHRYRAPRPEHLAFWADAAARYKNHPAVMFDLINEPHSISWEIWRNGGFVEEAKKQGDEDAFLTDSEKKNNKRGFQSPGMQAMLEAVRATGAKNVAVAGGLDWAYDLSGIVDGFALEDKSGNGVMYASHVYPWKKGWQSKLLDAAALHPILLGEVGADAVKMNWMPAEQQEDAVTWVPEMLGLIQKYRLNWTGWSFHPGASPRMLADWTYTPTPAWGEPAKAALAGKAFQLTRLR